MRTRPLPKPKPSQLSQSPLIPGHLGQTLLSSRHFVCRKLPKTCQPCPIVIISETWLTEHSTHLYHLENYTAVHEYRKVKKGGGVSIYVRSSMYGTLIASANIPKLTKIMNLLALKLKSNVLVPHMMFILLDAIDPHLGIV